MILAINLLMNKVDMDHLREQLQTLYSIILTLFYHLSIVSYISSFWWKWPVILANDCIKSIEPSCSLYAVSLTSLSTNDFINCSQLASQSLASHTNCTHDFWWCNKDSQRKIVQLFLFMVDALMKMVSTDKQNNPAFV